MKWFESTFAAGLAVFFMCLGIGTCCRLAQAPDKPIIEIKYIKNENGK